MKLRSRALLRGYLDVSDRTYREIAAAAGISHATLANLAREDGRRGCSRATAERLCRELGVELGHLFLSSVSVLDVQPDATGVRSPVLEGER